MLKKIKIFAILFCCIICFSGCSNKLELTPVNWCVREVLHNEPYEDGAAIDSYKIETLYLPEQETEYYDEHCYIITVIYDNADGDVQFDYWYCLIAIKQRCVHNFFDYFRTKNGENALICPDCVAIIDCDWFKAEIYTEE